MEYLTIHEPRTSHFRGMDPYKTDAYSRDSRSKPARSASPGRMPSSPYSQHRSNPDSSTSASEWRRWPESNTPPSGNYPPPSERLPAITAAHESAPAMGATSYPTAPRSQGDAQSHSPEWNRPAQPAPVRLESRVSALQPSEAPENQKTLKLPSFNSLVKQLSSDSSPTSPANSSLPVSADPWKRSDPYAVPPMEPIPYPLARPPAGASHGSPTAHHLAASEPPSPQVYSATSAVPPPFSPRVRPSTPARSRGHSRRSSDIRIRAYSQQPPLPPPPTSTGLREGVSQYGPPPQQQQHHHHQRTATYPSYPPPPPSGYASHEKSPLPYSHLPPPSQQLPLPDFRPSIGGPVPQAHHPQSQLQGPPRLAHGRTDSVLNSGDPMAGHYSASAPVGAPPHPGRPGFGLLLVHNSAGQQRKRRGNLPKDATLILRRWFDEHLEAPYPGEEVKHALCLQTGLQMSQVNNWFINARRRLPRLSADTRGDPSGAASGPAPGPGKDGRRSMERGEETAANGPPGGANHRPHEYWT